MLGSPDHVKRSGAVGLFALWRLAEALKQLAGPGVGVGSSSGIGSSSSDSRRGGGGSSRGAGGGGGGGGWGGRPHLFSCLLGGGGGVEEARVDAALSCMTADLLHLCDPAHPHSPVTSNDHTFWRALFPLPAEGEGKAEPRTPPGAGAASKASSASASTCGAAEPSSSSSSKAVATGGTACSPHGPTPVGTDTDTPGVTINITAAASVGAAAPPAAPTTSPSCHPGATPAPELLPPPWLPAPPRPSRFPAPPPALDVPAGFAPAGARDVDCVWLAPHHWVLQAPVFYTHADFCALGRGSWCLPPRLANPEASGGSADPRHLLPLQPLQPQQEPLGSTTSSGSSGTQQQRQQQRQYADAGEDFYFEWEEEWDVAGGRRGGRGGRGRGRGSSINALGAIVHSPLWHKRLLRCYSRVYAELMRRRKAAQPDRATALAWGLPV